MRLSKKMKGRHLVHGVIDGLANNWVGSQFRTYWNTDKKKNDPNVVGKGGINKMAKQSARDATTTM